MQLPRKLPQVLPLLWQAMSSFASSAALDEMFGAYAAARKGYARAAAMGWLLQRSAVAPGGMDTEATHFAIASSSLGSLLEDAGPAAQCTPPDAHAIRSENSHEQQHIEPCITAQELREADAVVRLAASTDECVLRAGVVSRIQFSLPNLSQNVTLDD
jgi:hypothetical protein